MRRFRDFMLFVRSRPLFALGLIIALGSLFLCIFGPYLTPYDPVTATSDKLHPPSATHLMGTDVSGMDVFSRVLAAARMDLYIALVATGLSMLIGIPLGALAGYHSSGSRWARLASEGLLRVTDILQSFPVFILALALVAVGGPSAKNVITAIAFVNAPVFLRLTRGEVLRVKQRTFVDAARCSGNSDLRVVFLHILPSAVTPALINSSVTVGYSILLAAGLSFVGAGVRIPTPEWGSMISIGANNMITGQWWPSFFPGVALAITVFGFAAVGDGLMQYLDPTKRS